MNPGPQPELEGMAIIPAEHCSHPYVTPTTYADEHGMPHRPRWRCLLCQTTMRDAPEHCLCWFCGERIAQALAFTGWRHLLPSFCPTPCPSPPARPAS